jgi:hypothetical protein
MGVPADLSGDNVKMGHEGKAGIRADRTIQCHRLKGSTNTAVFFGAFLKAVSIIAPLPGKKHPRTLRNHHHEQLRTQTP